ncbi:MAG: hypothetical protein SGILL_008083 [Bacillariaceae sp.]
MTDDIQNPLEEEVLAYQYGVFEESAQNVMMVDRVSTSSNPSSGRHDNNNDDNALPLTEQELIQIRHFLNTASSSNPQQFLHLSKTSSRDSTDANSEYSEFPETTHAWAVFADNPQRRANCLDRFVGTVIIFFQLFTYALFVEEAIDDYRMGVVSVTTTHDSCQAEDQLPYDNFQCEADITSNFDAVVAFSMLSIFLTPDILQALRAVKAAPCGSPTMMFAILAAIEVIAAFLAATVAVSYQLFIGEVTDAIEVGVGLLFVRELSARAYHGIRHKGVKQYKTFGFMVGILLLIGFGVEAACEALFSVS